MGQDLRDIVLFISLLILCVGGTGYAMRRVRRKVLIFVLSFFAGLLGTCCAGIREVEIYRFGYRLPRSWEEGRRQVVGFLIPATGVLLLGAAAARRKQEPGHCRICGYDLSGLREPRCPECGTAFVAAGLRKHDEQGTRRKPDGGKEEDEPLSRR